MVAAIKLELVAAFVGIRRTFARMLMPWSFSLFLVGRCRDSQPFREPAQGRKTNDEPPNAHATCCMTVGEIISIRSRPRPFPRISQTPFVIPNFDLYQGGGRIHGTARQWVNNHGPKLRERNQGEQSSRSLCGKLPILGSLGLLNSKIRRTEPTSSAVRFASRAAVNSSEHGIVLAITTSSSSLICQMLKAWQQCLWLWLLVVCVRPPRRPS